MIERIALFKLEARSADERTAAARALAGALEGLAGAREVFVGRPMDAAAAKSWDLAVVLTFDDRQAADAFLSSAGYREALSRALGGSVVVEKGWSFERVARSLDAPEGP
jgi:hypothetical protein